MPKRISKPGTKKTRGRKDSNQVAFATVQRTIQTSEAEEPPIDKATISAVMAALGRKGGKIGGKRRLQTMSDEERSQRGYEAARARWDKAKRKS
jgi:uncharacterized protein YneF (UPF0154 family)